MLASGTYRAAGPVTCEACLEAEQFTVKDCQHRICPPCQIVLGDACIEGCRGVRILMSAAVSKMFLDGIIESLPELERLVAGTIRTVQSTNIKEKEKIDEKIAKLMAQKVAIDEVEAKQIATITQEVESYSVHLKFAEYDNEAAEAAALCGQDAVYERSSFTVLKIGDLSKIGKEAMSFSRVSNGIKLKVSIVLTTRIAEGMSYHYKIMSVRWGAYDDSKYRPLTETFHKVGKEFETSSNFLLIATNETHACFVARNNFFTFALEGEGLAVCRPQGPERCLRLVGDQLEFAECPKGYTLIDLSPLAYRYITPVQDGSYGSALLILNVFTTKEVMFPHVGMGISRIRLVRGYQRHVYVFDFKIKDGTHATGIPRKFLD